MFPGLGGAQGAVIAMQFAGNIGDHGFMILMGGINTVNFAVKDDLNIKEFTSSLIKGESFYIKFKRSMDH